MALYGPLEGPRGALAYGFSTFQILLLHDLQTRPGPRFFTYLLRKSNEYKANSHKFGLFSIVPLTPKRGGSVHLLLGIKIWEISSNFFYPKLDIKSKLFTDANLPRTKEKFDCPI